MAVSELRLSALDDPKWRSANALLRRKSVVRKWLLRGPQRACLAAIIPGNSAVEQVVTGGLINFLNLYNVVLVVRVLLTLFPNPPRALADPVATLADPYLNLFRGIIPPLGGTIDLSPILAFLTLNVFTSASEALPCELREPPKTVVVMEGRRQAKARQRSLALKTTKRPK